MIIAGGQIFKMAALRFVHVSDEEINLMKEMQFRRTLNTQQSLELRSSKVRCENCAKCNKETI